jgi:hypothetical protein
MRLRDINDVQTVLQRYPDEKREKIAGRVTRYLKACTKLGVPLDSMVRVWQEAIEAIEVEEKFSFKEDDNWPRFEPIRSYEVYVSPVDLKF